MKTTIPEELKKDLPQTKWGKILTATPVVMAVVATALAGLASSEMTRAQYDRSLAAQQQSKAGDQWGLFQAKRLRGALQRSTLDLLQATAEVHALVPSALPNADALTLAALEKNELPAITHAKLNNDIKAALDAVGSSKPESEIAVLLKKVNSGWLSAAVQTAKDNANDFDAATKPLNEAVDRLERSVSADKSMARDFMAARLRYTAARYDAEAQLNLAIANLYELQVRQSNISAERHHNRSQRFFFGMLGAQAAVIVSTFAMAAQKRSLLWSLAAAAGAAAVAFAVYVYLFM